jgi:hypothetical protein
MIFDFRGKVSNIVFIFSISFLNYAIKKYVGVASSQNKVMLLGGNLPDSVSKYLHLGHEVDNDDVEIGVDEDESKIEHRVQSKQQSVIQENFDTEELKAGKS